MLETRSLKFVYGPVHSRRLGSSLGVNPIPLKTCNYSCVYCQLGRTLHLINERREFFRKEEILAEILYAVEVNKTKIDFVTFVGEGEPTLNRNLGWLIRETKRLNIPVAVITNGALLYREDVRSDLLEADVVLPSLDTAVEETFRKLNRPHRELRLSRIIDGMVEFRKVYRGELWYEVMLIKGINDSEEELEALKDAFSRIKPDRIYLNIPIRPPAEPWVEPADETAIVRARTILGDVIPIFSPETGEFSIEGFDDPVEAVVAICRRHPMRFDEILDTLSKRFPDIDENFIEDLVRTGKLREIVYKGVKFFTAPETRFGKK